MTVVHRECLDAVQPAHDAGLTDRRGRREGSLKASSKKKKEQRRARKLQELLERGYVDCLLLVREHPGLSAEEIFKLEIVKDVHLT